MRLIDELVSTAARDASCISWIPVLKVSSSCNGTPCGDMTFAPLADITQRFWSSRLTEGISVFPHRQDIRKDFVLLGLNFNKKLKQNPQKVLFLNKISVDFPCGTYLCWVSASFMTEGFTHPCDIGEIKCWQYTRYHSYHPSLDYRLFIHTFSSYLKIWSPNKRENIFPNKKITLSETSDISWNSHNSFWLAGWGSLDPYGSSDSYK